MSHLMYCSGFDLSVAASAQTSDASDPGGSTGLVLEVFQKRFAGEDMEHPRRLLRRELRFAKGCIESQSLSITTDEQAPLGHPCNDIFVLRLSGDGPSESAQNPVEFEIAIAQTGTKVAACHLGGWSHAVRGHKATFHGPGGVAINFECHRGYVD